MKTLAAALAIPLTLLAAGCHGKETPANAPAASSDGGSGSPTSSPSGSDSTNSSPALDIRHITVGMTADATKQAAKAAGMDFIEKDSAPDLLVFRDPTASGRQIGGMSQAGGSGLNLHVSMRNGRSNMIVIQEQGDTNGALGRDLEKKWGRPKSYFENPGGNHLPWWGDGKGVWADYEGEMTGFYAIHATIYAPAPPPIPAKEGVKL